MEPTTLDPQAISLAKAIRQSESGGDFAAKGKSGEYGAYQFTEPIWNKLKTKYGLQGDFGAMTPEEQNKAAYMQIKEWKDKGYNVGQVASAWNAGEGESDAYTGQFSDGSSSVGTNKQGVHFDVPAYAKSVASAYQTLKGGGSVTADPNNPSSTATPQEEGLGKQLLGRANDIGGAVSDAFTGKMSAPLISAPLQIGGALAGGIGDVIGAGLGLIPGVKQAEGALGAGIGKLAQTGIGQQVVGGAQDFAAKHPEASKDIGGAFNIAGLLGGGIGGALGKKAIVAGAKEGLLGATVVNALDKKYLNEAIRIAAPKETASILKGAIKAGRSDTQSGVIGIGNDAQTLKNAKVLQPLVKSGKIRATMTVDKQANALLDEIGSEAEGVRTSLKQMDIVPIVSPEELNTTYKNIIDKATGRNVIAGDTATKAKQLLEQFQSYLPKNGDITAEDILNARQRLDSWVRSQKGGKIFDPATDNALSGALEEVRHGANNLLYEKAPNLAIKESMARQSALYKILDNVATKGYKEVGTTRMGRFGARHPIIKGLVKGGIIKTLEGAGLGAGIHAFNTISGE